MSKGFDPGKLTVSQVQQGFRYLGVEAGFVLVPNPDTELWVKVKDERDEAVALLSDARDLLHHVAHNGQECPGCALEDRIDGVLIDAADEQGRVTSDGDTDATASERDVR